MAQPAVRGTANRPPVQHADLDWHSVLVLLGGFVALVALTGLVRSIPRTLAALAVGGILAMALAPVVALLQRRARLPRPAAVVAVLLAFGAAAGLAGALLLPPAARQARELSSQLPQVMEQLGDLPLVGERLVEADVPARVEATVQRLPERLAGDTTPLQRAARSFADGLVAATVTLLLAVTLLADGPRLVHHARRAVPAQYRPLADRIGALASVVVGKYVVGSLTVAGFAGVYVLIVGLVLGVPLTPLLAVWVALFNLVPQIGGAAGGVPFVLLGLTQGAVVGVACAVAFVLYLNFENHLMQPLLVGQAVQLSPPATMAAALIGVSAGGVVGALLAVPLVGAMKAVYLELRPTQLT